MKIIYLDNFRGFKDSYIPIEDVNFLVGENSTGKTSFLGILKLMSSPEFWLQGTLRTSEINFGHFNDIVSINSGDRSYFTIGFIESVNTKNKKGENIEIVGGYLITFTEHDGSPRPSFYAYYYGDKEYRVRFKNKTFNYKMNIITRPASVDGFIHNVFKSWVDSYASDIRGYNAAPKHVRDFSKIPLMMLASVLESVDENKSSDKSMKAIMPPAFTTDLIWLAPIRSRPRRTYDEQKLDYSPEGQHTPYLIKRILESKNEAVKFKKFIERIGLESGLFETVAIRKYGKGATAPFELDVLLNQKALSVSNVGYGVSQALPVIVEAFTRPRNTCFSIQQPEVHLHPKAQAALGDIIFELASRDNKRFLIETHSDYLIDRFRNNCKNQAPSSGLKSQILYFERTQEGNAIYQMTIGKRGELPSDQPVGYRTFFINEASQLLGI